MPYLTLETFTNRTTMPSELVARAEAKKPGFVGHRIAHHQGWIDARLAKRYGTPYTPDTAAPELVLGWLTDLVTWDCYRLLGVAPASDPDTSPKDEADRVRTEIAEAADGEKGLFELPKAASSPEASGVTKGTPLVYSEPTAYEWRDRQADAWGRG